MDTIRTESKEKPSAITITQLKDNLFEVMLCENVITEDVADTNNEEGKNTSKKYIYDMRLDQLRASSHKELVAGVVQMIYNCKDYFDFESPMSATEYLLFQDRYEKIKSACSQFFTEDADQNYKMKIFLTDEVSSEDLFDIRKMSLEDAKDYCINLTNTNLERFFRAHPMMSDVHGGVAKLYNVTKQKQALLSAEIQMYETSEKYNIPYELKWNAHKESSEPWEIRELCILSNQIHSYTMPYVEAQRDKENKIMQAESIDDLLKMNFTY